MSDVLLQLSGWDWIELALGAACLVGAALLLYKEYGPRRIDLDVSGPLSEMSERGGW
jgi:hypothetical protein